MESCAASAAAIRLRRQGCRKSCSDRGEEKRSRARSFRQSECDGYPEPRKAAALKHDPPALTNRRLAQPVLSLDLLLGQAADAGQRPPAIRDRDGHKNFAGAGRIVDANFHSIEMASNESGVLVPQGNVQSHAG